MLDADFFSCICILTSFYFSSQCFRFFMFIFSFSFYRKFSAIEVTTRELHMAVLLPLLTSTKALLHRAACTTNHSWLHFVKRIMSECLQGQQKQSLVKPCWMLLNITHLFHSYIRWMKEFLGWQKDQNLMMDTSEYVFPEVNAMELIKMVKIL